MDEQRRKAGRPQIYTGEPESLAGRTRRAQVYTGETENLAGRTGRAQVYTGEPESLAGRTGRAQVYTGEPENMAGRNRQRPDVLESAGEGRFVRQMTGSGEGSRQARSGLERSKTRQTPAGAQNGSQRQQNPAGAQNGSQRQQNPAGAQSGSQRQQNPAEAQNRSQRQQSFAGAQNESQRQQTSARALKAKVEKGTEQIRQSMKPSSGSARRREQENALKMRVLSVILGILALLLVGAIVYEIVLGYGTKESGAQRMSQQTAILQETDGQETEQGASGQ